MGSDISRREFLKITGAGTAGLIAGSLLPVHSVGRDKEIVYMSDESDPESVKIFKKIANNFTEDTGIKVNLMFVGFQDFSEKLSSMVAAGNPPQIIKQGGTEALLYLRRGQTIPVTDICDELDMRENIRYRWGGEDCFVPSNIDVTEGWYRSDLYAEKDLSVPITWNDFLNASETLNNPPDLYGAMVPSAKTLATDMVCAMTFFTNNVHWVHYDGRDPEVILDKGSNKQRAVESLDFLRKLHQYSPQASTAGFGELMANFASGNVAVSEYCGARLLDRVYDTNPDLGPATKPFRWPYKAHANPEENESKIPIWVEGYGIFDTDLNSEAKEFVKYFLTSDGFVDWLLTVPLHMVPYSLDVWGSERFTSHPRVEERQDVYNFIADNMDDMLPRGQRDASGDMDVDPYHRLHEAPNLGAEMMAKVNIGNQDPSAVIDQTADKLRKSIEREQRQAAA